MPDVKLTIKPSSNRAVPAMPRRTAEVTYWRNVGKPPDDDPDAPTTIRDVARATLDDRAIAVIELAKAQAETEAVVRFLSDTGSTRLERTIRIGGGGEIALELTEGDLKALAQPELTAELPQATVRRLARLVPTTTIPVSFTGADFRVAIIDPANWKKLGLDQVFNLPAIQTTSAEVRPEALAEVAALEWIPAHIGVGGGFDVLFPKKAGMAWAWWLVDRSNVALGTVNDNLETSRPDTLALPLPPFATAPEAVPGAPTRVPLDVTESDLTDNPDVFTEDPGAFCRPFFNPERILGERAFHVILRAEQPAISSEPTRKLPTFPIFDFDFPDLVEQPVRTRALREDVTSLAFADVVDRGAVFARPKLPAPYLDVLDRGQRGRDEVTGASPLDWEGDASRYQAATVVRGHILEYRARWRSNGYSLGTVAKTLTLAPRQVRRIQRIEWERLERTRREERTQLRDQVEDEVSRERTYEDNVEASLSEWARGESSSSTSAGAGGFGFAAPGFVIGGGGGHSRASSSSSTSGGRETRAAEEQRLRDTIRRFADSLRRLESVVVTEVSQEETVTGTTEIVRNANFAHSLTVIYYQILRHLKLETAFAAVRECLFVPFAIKPFTIARAYRWRDSIRRGLRDRRFAPALEYLRDVMNGFVGSTIPPGRRADQQIRYLRGSLTVNMGIERPRNAANDVFDEVAWGPLRPFLGVPALSIFTRLREVAEAHRDRLFQQEQAPRIAANWVNTLLLSHTGGALSADFTLATRYQFNGAVRVDFTVAVPAGQVVTRQMLTTIAVRATQPLTPGSVANLTSISYTYDTDNFRRSVAPATAVGDLINVQTGAVDPGGATASQTPDAWERQDERTEIIKAVQALIGHLNEHVEHYHKAIWWAMDRDRLFMLADGAYIPGTNGVSVASVIERDPIAIIGNSLVFRVSAGAFLGIDALDTPDKLYGWYADKQGRSEPMHVALPTDGLYAQTIMDECLALEEHYGDLDWVLNDAEPELGQLDPSLLLTRRAEPVATAPTPFPQTIINLQNAPEAPDPSGLAGALQAVQNANAFRDMAGLAGTQANAAAGLQTAASLATTFGQQAAALKLAEMAANSQATKEANQKLGSIKKAKDDKLVTPEKAAEQAGKVLEALPAQSTMPPFKDTTLAEAVKKAMGVPGSDITATPDGLKVSLAGATTGSGLLAGLANPLGPVLSTVDAVRDWMRKVELFKEGVAFAATQEHGRWAGRLESDAAVLPFLVEHATAGKVADPAAWAAEAAADQQAWSAAFISWCVQKGEEHADIASDPFGRSVLHSDYIAAAKRNRQNRDFANPFWLYRIDEVQPEVGDLLCKNRPGQNNVTFESVKAGDFTHVDVVTSVDSATKLTSIGGNRSNTVVKDTETLVGGFITPASANLAKGPFFAILRVRTNPLEGVALPD